MKKYDLSDCSIVIPVHIDSTERLEHVNFLYSYFNRYFINHQLIVIEQGIEPKTQFPLHVKREFLKSNETFSTAEVSNIGASVVKTPFFCKCDADALIHPKAIFDAFERLKNRASTSFVLPYNGVSFTIQNPLRKEIIQSFDFDRFPFVKKGKGDDLCKGMDIKNDSSTGLIHHFRTAVFKALGGYNEEFIGWGYEDDEIAARFSKLGHPKENLEEYNAFHLDHPRKPGDPIQAFKNYYRLLVVQRMPTEEILEYIQTWNRFTRPLAQP